MKPVFNAKIIPVFATLALLTACGSDSNNLYSDNSDGYVNISKVEGITFDIPETISTRATAVTRVADDQKFESNDIYSYANGNNEYMLFCMNDLIVLAEKGTTYDFAGNDDKDSCMENSGVLDSWCNIDGKKLTYIDGTEGETYKIIANVAEEISITTEMYGDYVGKLAVIEDGENEWSLLVGVKADNVKGMSSEQEDVVDTITSSMRIDNDSSASQETSYAVVAGTSNSASSSDSSAANSSNDTAVSNATSSISSDNASSGSGASKDDTAESNNSSTGKDAETSEVIASTSDTSATKNEASADDSTDNEEPAKEKNTTPTEHSNQNTPADKEKVLESDVYSMLDIGDMGLFSTMGQHEASYGAVKLNTIYTGSDAKEIVKKAATDDFYEYFDAPDGYSWQVAEFDIYYHDKGIQPYVNVKIEGLDGYALVYRGVKASQRTYDADYETTYDQEKNRNLRMMVYYAVPNGCNEYVLKFGDGTPDADNGSMAAYYFCQSGKNSTF